MRLIGAIFLPLFEVVGNEEFPTLADAEVVASSI
jgi:hypothetical protein